MTLVKDNSVQAINTALLSVKRDISALTATKSTCEPSGNPSSGSTDETTAGLEPGKTYNINISGNAATATRATSATTAETATNANHAATATTAENATTAETATTANKVANALTVNGKTYDGSSAVNAGVQTVANGGTGATDAASGFNTLADGVRDSSTPRDDEKMLLKPSGAWYKTTCRDFWNYIKGKADSVYASRYYFFAHNVYKCLGTATLRQNGDYLLIRVFSGNGYNAILGQDRAFDIHLRTSNGKDLNGLYYAGYAEYHLNGSSSSLVYVVQNSSTSFTIWVGPTNYTGNAFYTVENSDGSSWSSSTETSASLPSGAAQLTAKQIAYNTEDVTFNTAKASNKMVIPIGAPSQLEDGCIWIER